MKVNCIDSTKQANFKGLWGKIEYSHTQSLYGNEYDCEYYDQKYYPCIDETKEEIDKKLSRQEKILNELDRNDAIHSCHGSYISTTCGERLNITKSQLDELQHDCIRIINDEMPTGKLLNILG